MNLSRRLLLFPAILLAACFSSCETTPIVPGPGPGPAPLPDEHDHDHDDHDHGPNAPARISWELHPDGVGYDLDVVIDGEEHHVDHGGEYVRGHIERRDVPHMALSAYEVDLPDGEAMLYSIERHGSGYAVHSRFWDPYERRFSAPKRVKTIRH